MKNYISWAAAIIAKGAFYETYLPKYGIFLA